MLCAYCNEEKKCTREHIIPDGFIRRMNKSEQIRWTEAAPIRVVESDLVIKDVCGVCNGGQLSTLDNYAIKLIEKYHGKINRNTKKVVFKYNYRLLSKWLLKVCFNSARANKREHETNVYKKNVDYIMDRSDQDDNILIYAAFMDLNLNGKCHEYYHFDSNAEHTVDFFRIAQFRLRDTLTHDCVSKVVMINSFAFLIISFDHNVDKDYKESIENALAKTSYKYTKLDRLGRVKLVKDREIWEQSVVSSATLHKNFLLKRDPSDRDSKYIEFELSKVELMEMDYSRLDSYLSMVTQDKDGVINNYQKLILHVSGYDDDTRELYQIAEFVNYINNLIVRRPELLWFMNLDLDVGYGFFVQYLFAYIKDITFTEQDSAIRINNKKVKDFLVRSFTGVNKLLNVYSVDRSMNDKFTSKLQQILLVIQERANHEAKV